MVWHSLVAGAFMPSILLLCSASLSMPAGAAGFVKGSGLPEAEGDVQKGKHEKVPPGKALSRSDTYHFHVTPTDQNVVT